jgi:hypothetical protein
MNNKFGNNREKQKMKKLILAASLLFGLNSFAQSTADYNSEPLEDQTPKFTATTDTVTTTDNNLRIKLTHEALVKDMNIEVEVLYDRIIKSKVLSSPSSDPHDPKAKLVDAYDSVEDTMIIQSAKIKNNSEITVELAPIKIKDEFKELRIIVMNSHGDLISYSRIGLNN